MHAIYQLLYCKTTSHSGNIFNPSFNTYFLNDPLKMGSIEEGWQEFQHQMLPPYNNVIRGGHVTWLDAERCEMMFVASDLLFTCSRNFVWNTKKVKMGMLNQIRLIVWGRISWDWNSTFSGGRHFDHEVEIPNNDSISRSQHFSWDQNCLFRVLISWSFLWLSNRSWDLNSKKHY